MTQHRYLWSMLPKEAIEEFKKLYQKRYGVDLRDEEASFRANNLINLYAAVYSESSVGLLKRSEESKKISLYEPTKSNN